MKSLTKLLGSESGSSCACAPSTMAPMATTTLRNAGICPRGSRVHWMAGSRCRRARTVSDQLRVPFAPWQIATAGPGLGNRGQQPYELVPAQSLGPAF
eukprot:SAG22_NODE_797_length_7135_cov_211.841103_2_plen_98_part_00